MNRTMLTLIAAAAAASLAGCVPSSLGYGNYGGYGPTPNGQSGYGSNGYGSSYPNNQNPYGQSGYGGSSRPTMGNDGTFRCESNDQRMQRCLVDTRRGVSLVRQESDAACVQGRTWGSDRDGVWVSGGCRGRFALGNYGSNGNYGNYGNYGSNANRGNTNNGNYGNYGNNDNSAGQGNSTRYSNNDSRVVRCESQDGRRDTCGLPFRARNVTLSRQLSDARCSQGSTWGWSGDAVWVDRGCRAEFTASN